MSPTRRREAVTRVRRRRPGEPSVSERRACKALDQPRSTQHYVPRVKDDEGAVGETYGVREIYGVRKPMGSGKPMGSERI